MTAAPLLLGLFLAVICGVMAAGYWLMGRLAGAETSGMPGNFSEALQWIGEVAPPTSRDGDQLRRKLVAAGYRAPSAIARFRGIRFAGIVMAASAAFTGAVFSGGNIVVATLCGVGIAYLVPDRILDFLVRSRQRRLRAGLPAALDLLVLGVESGQAIDTAILESSRGLRGTFPDLAAELNLLSMELRTAATRADSLRAMADRNGEPELKKLASVFVDTDRFGSSLAPALRNHARYLRIRMRQQAQEAARKVGVKLIFPVFFLIFPSVILVTLGPAVMLITTQLKEFMK